MVFNTVEEFNKHLLRNSPDYGEKIVHSAIDRAVLMDYTNASRTRNMNKMKTIA